MTSKRPRNPFTPSFGQMPLYMAGRDRIIDEFDTAFNDSHRSPELTTLVSGARGTGKTTLLGKISELALQNGWISVKTIASEGMLEDIYLHAIRASQHLSDVSTAGSSKRLTGVGIAQLVDLTWENTESSPSNWRIRIEELLDQLEPLDSGLLIEVDEMDPSVDEMIKLAQIYQLLVMDNHRVALVMAGLPYNIEKAKADKRISFVRRAQQRHLGRIDNHEVAKSMRLTVEESGRAIDDDALNAAVQATEGFAFMIQLVGYRMWNAAPNEPRITLDHAIRGIDEANRELASYVLESTYRELSNGDVAFLQAMLQDDGDSALEDIAARMDKSSSYVAVYKKRLLNAGIIGETDRNRVGIELPGFRRYLAKHIGEGRSNSSSVRA